jgi:hypothetical protein
MVGRYALASLEGKDRNRHVLEVLEILRIPPQDFFELAYGGSRSDKAQELMRSLEARGYRGGPDVATLVPEEATLSDAELDRRILEALRRISLKAKPPAEPETPGKDDPGNAGDIDPAGSTD